MHELALCDAIVEAALGRAGGRQVVGVRVRFGGRPMNPHVIDQDFRRAAAGTAAADAYIDLVFDPLSARCRSCGFVTPATDPLAMVACSRCESLDIEALGDDRIVLESVTVATPEPEAVDAAAVSGAPVADQYAGADAPCAQPGRQAPVPYEPQQPEPSCPGPPPSAVGPAPDD